MTRPTETQIRTAIRAARHFTLVANGRLTGQNSAKAFLRDAQELADALAEMGFVGGAAVEMAAKAA